MTIKKISITSRIANSVRIISPTAFCAVFLASGTIYAQQNEPKIQTNSTPVAIERASSDNLGIKAVGTSAQTADGAQRIAQPNVKPDENAIPFRIGINDVIDIQFFNKPQLNRTMRVGADGTISMPLLDQNVVALCKTEAELSEILTAMYKKYVRQPYISVFVREYSSQPIAVMGKVEKPGAFQLLRKMRLVEALSLAGGPSKEAGAKIIVTHTATEARCELPKENQSDEDVNGLFASYRLKDVVEGKDAANPWIRQGDIITVLKSEQIYVVGNVDKPQAIELDQPKTLTQAIAAAGGMLPATKKKAVLIVRQNPDNPLDRTETTYDLEAIKAKKIEDPVLQPNDIVDVPTDGQKKLRNKVLDAVLGGVGNVFLRIPGI